MEDVITTQAVDHFEVETVPSWRGEDDQLIAILADGTRRFIMVLEAKEIKEGESPQA